MRQELQDSVGCFLIADAFGAGDAKVLAEKRLVGDLADHLIHLYGSAEFLQQVLLALLELFLALLDNDLACLHRVFLIRGIKVEVRASL